MARAQQEAAARTIRRGAGDGAGGGPWLVETDGNEVCLTLRDEDWQALTIEEAARATRRLPTWLEVKRLMLGPGEEV